MALLRYVPTLDPLLPPLNVDPGASGDGCPHPWERAQLLNLACQTHARTAFEIGTYTGETARALAQLPEMKTVWTLDLGPSDRPSLPVLEQNPGEWESDWRWIDGRKTYVELPPEVIRLFGDSAQFDFSPYRGRCDVVFVMGAHSWEYMTSDLHRAFEIVSPHGAVVWHAGNPSLIERMALLYNIYLMPDSNRMALVRECGCDARPPA